MLVIGDSTQTVPLSVQLFRLGAGTADLAYVDGGHVDPVCYEDLNNFVSLLPSGGSVILDDYCKEYGGSGVIPVGSELLRPDWLR